MLDDALMLVGTRLEMRSITLIKRIDDDVPMVSGSTMRLEQVFINLIQNSIDAIDSMRDGVIDIHIHCHNDHVAIELTDNGCGMTPDVKARLFEPFFTTKEPGRGTGLGLSIIYGIVEEHHGSITCETEPEKGTKFIILIPQLLKTMKQT